MYCFLNKSPPWTEIGTAPHLHGIFNSIFLQRVRAFTRADVIMEVETGGKFSLFDGMVSGDFISLVCVVFYYQTYCNICYPLLSSRMMP